jgi:Protein of unknown function (DUF1569)
MTEIEPALLEDRNAVGELAARARAVAPERWSAPRAPGKWSPGQVCDHVARSYEASRDIVCGVPGKGMPRWLRPIVRVLYLGKVMKTGRFPKGSKAPERLRPSPEPLPLEESLARIEKARADFEAEARKRAGLSIDHPVFGRIRVADYVRLSQLHTRHHARQL